MCDSQVNRMTPPPLPFKHLKGFPSSAICPSRVHEINLGGAPYELVKTLLVLMKDVISEGSGEHVCLHNLVRVSLTKKALSERRFKPNKNSRHLRTLSLKLLVGGFLSTCNNGYSFQSKISNSSKWNIAACLFVLMKLHMEGPTSALPV